MAFFVQSFLGGTRQYLEAGVAMCQPEPEA